MPIVSFDFDGVLHQNVKVDRYTPEGKIYCYGPVSGDYTLWSNLVISPLILEKIEEEISAGHTLVIVSARDQKYEWSALKHLDKLGIREKFQQILCGCKDKTKVLKKLGAIRHYEDSPKHIESCRAAGIEVIQVYPLSNRIFDNF